MKLHDRCNETPTSTDHDTRHKTSARFVWEVRDALQDSTHDVTNNSINRIGVNIKHLTQKAVQLEQILAAHRPSGCKLQVRFGISGLDWNRTSPHPQKSDVAHDDLVDSIAWNLDSIWIGLRRSANSSRDRTSRRVEWSTGISAILG